MKISIFNYTPFNALDGNNSVEFYLADALNKKHQINFVCSNKIVAIESKKKFPHSRIKHLKMNLNRLSLAKYINFARFSYKASKCVNKNTEVVFGQHLCSALAACLSKGKFKVGGIDDFWSEYWRYNHKGVLGEIGYKAIRRVENFVIKKLDLVFTTTLTQKIELVKRGVKKCVVVGVGANLEKFKPLKKENLKLKKQFGFKKEDNVICYLGAIKKHDGLEYLLRFKRNFLEKNRIKFLIIGDGPYLNHLKKEINNKGLREYFRFSGWVEQKIVPSLMTMCKFNIIPLPKTKSTKGVLPYKLFEAMAMGIPSIVTSLPGIREFVHDNKEIIFFDPNKIHLLENELTKALADKKRYQKMKENGLKTVKNHNWKDYGERLAKIIEGETKRW